MSDRQADITPPRGNFRRILFCSDFSENADFAFGFAVDAAVRNAGSTLYLLHVLPEPDAQFWKTYIYASDADPDAKAKADIDARIARDYLIKDPPDAVIALVIVWWPSYARLIRGLVMEMKTREFVEGARSIGASSPYILFRTVLPNCISSAIVLATLDIGNAILSIAGLSFLGLGPDPTSPEWGRMVSIGIDFFDQWWMWLFPGLAIATVVLAFNFIGDGLRDVLDPRMKH